MPGQGFPLRDAWWLRTVGHDGLKWMMLAFWGLCLSAGGDWRRGAAGMALIAVAVSLLKHSSPFSCPWDLPAFGAQGEPPGRCLPAGHPVTGFMLLGLHAALLPARPRAARFVLLAAWVIGLLAGAVQVARGAHFVSHVLWTAWVASLLAPWTSSLTHWLAARLTFLSAWRKRSDRPVS